MSVKMSSGSTGSGSLPNTISGEQKQPMYGLTSPLSTAGPKPLDLELSASLEKTLRESNIYETKEEMEHRIVVLGRLNELLRQWIREVTISKNVPEHIADTVGGSIHTFGSFRLGVHNRGSDIDALLVAPRHIDRTDFFESLPEFLRSRDGIKNLQAITEAYVPVLQMEFEKIEIDLVFARLALARIPDNLDLMDETLLKNLDNRCVRSLNGCRVTDAILSLVPNIEAFRLALRAIKHWAKRRSIYSNVLGFFGGVTWAMLVARACQLYPNALAATLVHKFFMVYSQWYSDTGSGVAQPVLLTNPSKENPYNLPLWDFRKPSDRMHLMPVITPVYPQQNSTFNVTHSTRSIIIDEIQRGLRICSDVYSKQATWSDLFEQKDFFNLYKHFIAIFALSKSHDSHLKWKGVVESKIRLLIGSLENHQSISLAHVNPDRFPVRPELYPEKVGTCWFIGLFIKKNESGQSTQVDLNNEISMFASTIRWFSQEGSAIDARYVKRRELGNYLPPNVYRKRSSTSRDRKSSIGASPSRQHCETPGFILHHDETSNHNPSSSQDSASPRAEPMPSKGTEVMVEDRDSAVHQSSRSDPPCTEVMPGLPVDDAGHDSGSTDESKDVWLRKRTSESVAEEDVPSKRPQLTSNGQTETPTQVTSSSEVTASSCRPVCDLPSATETGNHHDMQDRGSCDW